MNHISNGPYQLLKKDPKDPTKIKAKTMKQLKDLKDNELIDNKLHYYLKPTDSLVPDFTVNQKYTSQDVLLFHIVAPRCTILTNM